MVKKILDLHIHSRYSRACSKELTLPNIAKACEVRGIDVVSTGDFTHPGWLAHMKEQLVETTAGIYHLRDHSSTTRFVIGTEIASIKKHAGQTRRVHHLIFSPNLDVAEQFVRKLGSRGINLKADGRPIIGLTSKNILSLMLEIDPRMVMIPAHAWTPWFGVFGSKGGYDALTECFEDLTPHIYAIETGLSSDPAMNWRLSALDDITFISNSDAHSAQKLGREANVMQFVDESAVSYDEIFRIIREQDRKNFLFTIEFYPQEGKYHLDGHVACQFVCEPEETKRLQGICPRCGKELTIGVMYRVRELADRNSAEAKQGKKIPYKSMVPLPEIIADTFQVGVATKTVMTVYQKLIHELGNEFFILLEADVKDIARIAGNPVATALERVRTGQMVISPGYDGQFGVVHVFHENEYRGIILQKNLL